MLQVGLEEQVAAFFGRAPYERRPDAPAGSRNGYVWHTVKSEAGPLTLRPPKVRGTAEPFGVRWPARLDRTTPELEELATQAYVRGLSDRDVEGLYAAVFGGSFSKSAVSRATARLQADFDRWRTRDLSALKVVYLFLDGQFHAARQGSREQEGILAAYAIGEDGRAVLLHLAQGPRGFRRLTWRRGTKGPLTAEFAAVRVRVADGPLMARAQHLPGESAWLVCERRASGEQKYYLTNHPATAPLRQLATAIKARWVCEQAHQQLKDELGLDHFEGRAWLRLHHHQASDFLPAKGKHFYPQYAKYRGGDVNDIGSYSCAEPN